MRWAVWGSLRGRLPYARHDSSALSRVSQATGAHAWLPVWGWAVERHRRWIVYEI